MVSYGGALASADGNQVSCSCTPCCWVTSSALVTTVSSLLLGLVFVPAKKVLSQTLFACCKQPSSDCQGLAPNATNITDFCTSLLPDQIRSNNFAVGTSAAVLGVSALVALGITGYVVYRNRVRSDYVSFL